MRASGRAAPARPPRYQQLADALVAAIEAGDVNVGDELPTEKALCTEHGVSRFTVRQALQQVEEAGLIVRRQGAGTRVVARRRPPRYRLALHTEAEVLRYANETVLEVRHTGPATRAAADRLGVGDAAGWTEIRGVRRQAGGGAPVCTATVLLRDRFAPAVEDLGPTVAGAMFPRVLDRFGLVLERIEQTVAATALPAGDARSLRAPVGTPALAIERRYLAEPGSVEDDGPFQVSLSMHPGDRYAFTLTLDRDGATTPRPP